MLEILKGLIVPEQVWGVVVFLLALSSFVERAVEILAPNFPKLPASTINKVISFAVPLLITVAGILGKSEGVGDAQKLGLEVAAVFATFLSTTVGAWLIHQLMKLANGEVVIGFLKSRGAQG